MALTETWIRPENTTTLAALELDVLFSTFSEDGTPLVVLGDNIHQEKLLISTLCLSCLASSEYVLQLLTNQVTNWTLL